MTLLKDLSDQLAKDISERNIMDLGEVSFLIETRIKSSLNEILIQTLPKEEQEYLNLLTEQLKHRQGSPQYSKICVQITRSKMKKAAANRLVNNKSREDKLSQLKEFVLGRFGRSVLDDFDAEQSKNEPIYSTKN